MGRRSGYVSPVPTYPEVLSHTSPNSSTKRISHQVLCPRTMYVHRSLTSLTQSDRCPFVFVPGIRRLFLSNNSTFLNLVNLSRRTLVRALVMPTYKRHVSVSLTRVILPSVSSNSRQTPYNKIPRHRHRHPHLVSRLLSVWSQEFFLYFQFSCRKWCAIKRCD